MQEPRHQPGDRVILSSTGEKGVVVCTWINDQDVLDCYVAFFGQEWPTERAKPEKPYVLRYYASSLTPASEA